MHTKQGLQKKWLWYTALGQLTLTQHQWNQSSVCHVEMAIRSISAQLQASYFFKCQCTYKIWKQQTAFYNFLSLDLLGLWFLLLPCAFCCSACSSCCLFPWVAHPSFTVSSDFRTCRPSCSGLFLLYDITGHYFSKIRTTCFCPKDHVFVILFIY